MADKIGKVTRWPTEAIPRSAINPAEYNPRVIDPHGKRKLKKSLGKFGLVETLVWNKRTGNLVGGHQRLGLLDEEDPTLGYQVEATVVDLDLKSEKELNIALNNQHMQGQYDPLLFAELVHGGIDLANTGFDRIEVEQFFADNGVESLLDDIMSPEGRNAADAAAAEIADLQDEVDGIKKAAREASKPKKPAPTEEEKIQAIKARREEYAERAAYENQGGYYTTVVFSSNERKFAFMRFLGQPEAAAMLDGDVLAEKCGCDINAMLRENGEDGS